MGRARLYSAEQQQRRDAEAQREASGALTATLDLDHVLEIIMESLFKVIPYDSASIMLIEGKHMRVFAGRGLPEPEKLIGGKRPVKNPLFEEIFATLKPLILSDAQADARFEKWGGTDYIRGWMGVPLMDRGRAIGVLTIDSRVADFYSQQDANRAQSFANHAASAIEKARLFSETRKRMERLQALHNIDLWITSNFDLDLTLDLFLKQVTSQLSVDAATILLYDTAIQMLSTAASWGFNTPDLTHTPISLGEGYAGKAILNRKMVVLDELQEREAEFSRSRDFSNENFEVYYAVPLIARGEIKGVLEIFHRAPLEPDGEWVDYLQTLATQAAIAIDNATLYEKLQRSHNELLSAYDETLKGWAKAIDLRDHETAGHTQRVMVLTLRLATAMSVPHDELANIRRGALLHDIGKMGTPDHILNKPGPLTDEEWETIREHPAQAHKILSEISFLEPVLDIPYCHHEKWDGTGYPQGLKGEQIPLAARIFAVVDVWDALISDRPYRKAWPRKKALDHIEEQAGKHFDPQVVEMFLPIIGREVLDSSEE
jgi:putative nucleotidyltransferase with HDIG domain